MKYSFRFAYYCLFSQIMEQGHRKFFNLPTRPPEENSQRAASSVEVEEEKEDKSNLLQYINDNIIGNDRIFGGPFGDRRGMHNPACVTCTSYVHAYNL